MKHMELIIFWAAIAIVAFTVWYTKEAQKQWKEALLLSCPSNSLSAAPAEAVAYPMSEEEYNALVANGIPDCNGGMCPTEESESSANSKSGSDDKDINIPSK